MNKSNIIFKSNAFYKQAKFLPNPSKFLAKWLVAGSFMHTVTQFNI